jgi:isoleucyl-tRNA synthetase
MELASKFDAKAIESQIKEYTHSLDLEKMIFESDKPESIRFIEGPPTMNGLPHAGHLRGRVIKDLWYRFNTLQGKKIQFNGGWDTQGLPVELQVEKELGVTGGKTEAIKEFGIEKIVEECKNVVKKYNEKWLEVDDLLGMSFNHEKAYWTYRDQFIEREWQVLKKAYENKILEEDFTVIAYCPSCRTSLSHAEVNQGYEEVKDPSLYYKVKLADEDAYLIVWTTMPFTLVTDAMVGLHPDEDYVHVKVENETWIVGKTRLEEFMTEVKIEDYKIEKTSKGSEFEGRKYIHPLLDKIPALAECAKKENYHVAVSENFVDVTAGSGLVHLSPANGEDDIKIANKRKVKVFSPIDDEVKFTSEAGAYQGLFVRDADRPIVEDIKDCNALVKIGKIKHKYPLCWRSHHPIVWLARKGWFYKLDRLDNKAIDAAESIIS